MAAIPQFAPESAEDARWLHWDRYLESRPEAGFMQSSWWADFRVTAGYEYFATILRASDDIAGGALVMKLHFAGESCFYYIPEGPVLPADASLAGDVFASVLDAIDDHRRSHGHLVSHLRIEPRWEALPRFVRGFRQLPEFTDPYMEPRSTLCVDLSPSETDICSRMKVKGRYNVRLAMKHGVKVKEDNSDSALEDFMHIYKDMTTRQGLARKPREYFEVLLSILRATGNGSMFFAEYRGMRLATAIVVFFGERSTYFYGASLAEHRHVMAPYLLHFEIMRRSKASGQLWYDLWGVDPPGATEHPWQQIGAFKRKFGGRETQLVPTLDYVYDTSRYRLYADTMANRRAG